MISLGIDCGTQSLKVVALDGATGLILASAHRSLGLVEGLPPGHLEQHPEDWWQALSSAVAEVLARLGPRRSGVAALGVSGQQHGFVPLDAGHRVLRPAKLWCDTSTTGQCRHLREVLGGRDALLSLVGNDLRPGFTAPKILWLKENEPDNFHRLAHVALPHDYLNLRLSGNLRMEYGDASGTALLDVRRRVWSSKVCAAIDDGLEEKLPRVGSSREPCGLLRSQLAAAWGLPAGVVVSAGGGDNMMAAFGTGCLVPGATTASLGTSGTIFSCSPEPVIDPCGDIAAFCDSNDAWLPLLCTMNVTVATGLFQGLFGWDHERMDAEVASVAPGAGGLLFLPYLQGERTPDLPEACGVLHGLKVSNLTPAHLARAAMEGVTLALAGGLRRLRELGVDPPLIRLAGGGSRSGVWRELCAEIFGCPVVTMREGEAAALGAALQALATVCPSENLADLVSRCAQVQDAELVEPRRGFDYRELLDRQETLRDTIFHRPVPLAGRP